MRHLTVQDIHLYDREMRSTKGMVENSLITLIKLREFIEENEDVVVLNVNGDIQHRTPVNKFNRKEVAKWREEFRKIGNIMYERFKKNVKGYKLVGASKEVKEKFKTGKILPIFTTKGNHDIDNLLGHTFYDELIEEGLIVNVKGLLVSVDGSKTYFSYRDFGTEDRKIPKLPKGTDVIALEHNNVLHDESVLWKVPDAEKKFLDAEDVVKGTDVTILGHVHDKVDPLYIGKDGTLPVLWQAGSLARTEFVDESKRDVGYGALMDFGDVETYMTVEFDLMPYKEYFSYKKMVRKNQYKEEYKDFSLKMEEKERVSTDFRDDINSFDDVEEDVKKYAIKVMESIHNNE